MIEMLLGLLANDKLINKNDKSHADDMKWTGSCKYKSSICR